MGKMNSIKQIGEGVGTLRLLRNLALRVTQQRTKGSLNFPKLPWATYFIRKTLSDFWWQIHREHIKKL